MNNQKAAFELIKRISGQSNVLTIPRVFIEITGDIKSALLLSQCVYWSDRTKRVDGYFYKSSKEWQSEIGLTRHEIEHAREVLEKLGFLQTKLIKANNAPTVHYSIDMDAVTNSICRFLDIPENSKSDLPETGKSDFPESDKSLTETTTEITTEITLPAKPPKRDLYPLAAALAEVTGMDIKKNAGRLFKEAKNFDDGDGQRIIEQYGKGGAWYLEDWRGLKGQKPTPSQIRETWIELYKPVKRGKVKYEEVWENGLLKFREVVE